MTCHLGSLGPYRIERTEEYIPGAADNSSAEMIRGRGSKPEPPHYVVPSHLYKYSQTELGLYLKERKNVWRHLGRLLGIETEISDPELMVHFPISRFPDVAKIVPFVMKRARRTPLTELERERASHLRSYRKDIMNKSAPKFNESTPDGNITPPLERFAIKEVPS